MISFFQKKTFFVDLLEGFTDFHNHLLPGIDDGAATPEVSLEMIEKFRKFGVKSFVCTPHIMGEYYPNTKETIGNALDKLKPLLPADITISAAGEYMMDQHLMDDLEEGENLLTITGNNVLVEMSYFQAPINLKEILFKILTSGHKPILAHPERYAYFHSKNLEKYTDLKNRGCSFQMNMLSLTSHYGLGIQKAAGQLLEAGMIDFISSDAHRLEHLVKLERIKLNKKQVQLIEPIIEKSKALFT
ncbi:tyrosine-protein phosphatase [Salegentibacter sp. F14]